MGRRPLPQTKRARQVLLQAWFDPETSDEYEVIQAIEQLRTKHQGITNKEMIAKSILYSAKTDGIELQRALEPLEMRGMFQQILDIVQSLFTMVSEGRITATEASSMVRNMNANGYTLDAISESLGGNYNGFAVNGGDDDE